METSDSAVYAAHPMNGKMSGNSGMALLSLDSQRPALGLQQLMAEDPALRVRAGQVAGQVVL